MEHFETLPLTEFDIATCGTYFQMIKAYLPYTSGEQQKMFALFIRLAELMQTLEFYKNMPCPSPLARAHHDAEHIMNDIKRFCPKKDCEIFNMMSNFNNMNEIFNIYNAMNSEPQAPDKSSDMLKNFLSPKQQQMYEQYSRMLNNNPGSKGGI